MNTFPTTQANAGLLGVQHQFVSKSSRQAVAALLSKVSDFNV